MILHETAILTCVAGGEELNGLLPREQGAHPARVQGRGNYIVAALPACWLVFSMHVLLFPYSNLI
jgi:hypothetical protein